MTIRLRRRVTSSVTHRIVNDDGTAVLCSCGWIVPTGRYPAAGPFADHRKASR